MATKKPLIIQPDEFNNLVFDENSAETLTCLISNLKALTRLCNYAKKVRKATDQLTKRELCNIINKEPMDCSFIDLRIVDKISSDWFFSQMIEKEKAVRITKYDAHFNGSKLTTSFRYAYTAVTIDNKVFSARGTALLCDKRYIIAPGIDKQCEKNETLWVICDKNDEKEVVEEVLAKMRNYNMYKNRCVEISASGYRITSMDSKFDCEDLKETIPHLEKEMLMIRSFAANYSKFRERNTDIKHGVLFYGVPGSGKTTLVRSLMKEFIENGGTAFYYTYSYGDRHDITLSIVYDIAEDCGPAMVVLEDFDLIAARRKHEDGSIGAPVSSQLLKLLEEGNNRNNIITIATTNLLDGIDEAAIRHGRMDSSFLFDYPDMKIKENILKLHLNLYNVSIPFEKVKEVLCDILKKHITGATIMSIVKTAKQYAVGQDREITLADLEYSCNHIKNIRDVSNSFIL